MALVPKANSTATANTSAAVNTTLNQVILPIIRRMMEYQVHPPVARPQHAEYPYHFFIQVRVDVPEEEELAKWAKLRKWIETQTKGEYFHDMRSHGQDNAADGRGLESFLQYQKLAAFQYGEFCFRLNRDAVLFKMFFSDYFTKKIKVPIGTIIANEIIGVQPMSAPTGQAFSLKVRYSGDSEVEPEKQNYSGSSEKERLMQTILKNTQEELTRTGVDATDAFKAVKLPIILNPPEPRSE